MRFLHTSDWQLGMTRHFLAGEAQARFSEARLDAIATLADLAVDRECAFVVVAGDVFETNQPDARTVTRTLERLGRFTVPVYLLPGNHDAYDPSSIYRNTTFLDRCPPHVEVLTDGTPRIPLPGVEVVGAPWPNKEPLRDLVAEVCEAATADGVLRVVVGHGGVAEVAGSFAAPGTVDLGRVEATIRGGAVTYVALGDRHSCTRLGSSGRVWYSGAPEPTAYVEEDAGTALVVDLDGDQVTAERCEVGTWRFHELVHAVDSDGDLDGLEATLDAVADPARAIVKVKLEGTLDLAQIARLDALLADRGLRFGALEHPRRHRDVAVRVSGDDLRALPLNGYAAVARDGLHVQAAGEGEDAEAAIDALGLLLRLVSDGHGRSRP